MADELATLATGQTLPNPAPISQQLAGARRHAQLTQDDLAARSGVSRPTIYRVESGDFDPRLSTIEELARALGMELMLVPQGLVAELLAFVRSGGKLVGQPAGAAAPGSALDRWGQQLQETGKDG